MSGVVITGMAAQCIIGPSSVTKLDPLCQRQLGAPVDCVGLAAHVSFPGVGAGFAATAGFFFAAEGSVDLSPAGANVDVGGAG